ncbi:hypothetical protein L2D14_08960 [Thalassospiraceae bacterium LMO-JJ14]|nr:hypothetical protein L2D14_08960 [Thalassospiraceae bacterium LMO-JJ14]
MNMNAWDDIVRNDIIEVLNGAAGPVNDAVSVRPWPPVMIRDFLGTHDIQTRDVEATATIGYIADWLAASPGCSVSVYDEEYGFMGVAVDEDVMALIKRDGVRALDYPIIEAVQRNRPVCSITDSPYVVLQALRKDGWDRVGVAEHGRVIGVLRRRDLVNFVES